VSSDGGESDDIFGNYEHQKRLAKAIVKQLGKQPDTERTPVEIYEKYLKPGPLSCSLPLTEYLIERLVCHDDGIVERCADNANAVQVDPRRIDDYIHTHLDAESNPFPDVDPTPYRDRSQE
jgi:hypothetical protein